MVGKQSDKILVDAKFLKISRISWHLTKEQYYIVTNVFWLVKSLLLDCGGMKN